MRNRIRFLGPHAAVSTLVLVLVVAASAYAHEGAHGDPELLGHWRAQVHLVFQWAHLVAFGLWVGGLLAATRLPTLSLERLLFASWAFFLVSLGTGSYNMEFARYAQVPPPVQQKLAASFKLKDDEEYETIVSAIDASLDAAGFSGAIRSAEIRQIACYPVPGTFVSMESD